MAVARVAVRAWQSQHVHVVGLWRAGGLGTVPYRVTRGHEGKESADSCRKSGLGTLQAHILDEWQQWFLSCFKLLRLKTPRYLAKPSNGVVADEDGN